MLTILAWIPRVMQVFGFVRSMSGVFGYVLPFVSRVFRGRGVVAAA